MAADQMFSVSKCKRKVNHLNLLSVCVCVSSHPDAAVIVLGDFNHTNLSSELPSYHQQVTCPSRGNNTLDHCYTTFKQAYRAFPRAPLGKSDHAMLLLIPTYKQKLKSIKPTLKSVRSWSTDAVERLKDCLACTNWDVFRAAGDLNDYTDTVTSYIHFCEQLCIPTKTVKLYNNNKPWFTKEIQQLRKEKNSAYITGIKEQYTAAK